MEKKNPFLVSTVSLSSEEHPPKEREDEEEFGEMIARAYRRNPKRVILASALAVAVFLLFCAFAYCGGWV